MKPRPPTKEAYGELQKAYDFFNRALFSGRLPSCLITYQRKNRSYGYFSPERWDGGGRRVADEIAMNPQHFSKQDIEDVLSTLVHEMVHLEQFHFGTPSRAGYHNAEWASAMERVGLIPSNTGRSGGSRVGQHMTHYIEAGGRFQGACKKLFQQGFELSWFDRFPGKATNPKPPTRTKYSCPGCGLNVWGKPEIRIRCEACDERLKAVA